MRRIPRFEVDEVTLPAYWASALVNGDFSSLDEAETLRCKAVLADLAGRGHEVVDVKRDASGEAVAARFTWSYTLYDPNAEVSGGEVLDYVILRRR